jgi:CheY-like chemotaxis protein
MAAREAGAGRVLVVEDDESTALFVTRVLSRNGFEASWVMDAEQASVRLENEPFDVLLADYRLPGRSGVDLARDIRLALPGIGIAVMTSFAEADTERTVRTSGADEFFEKPLHSSSLVTRIRALVTQSRASNGSGPQNQESPPARGTCEVMPVGAAPECSSALEDSVPLVVAGSGPEKQPATRDADLAQRDHGIEGASGTPRACFSALSERATHPASTRTLQERLATPVLMWASAAPQVSIHSTVGRVAGLNSRPDWSSPA